MQTTTSFHQDQKQQGEAGTDPKTVQVEAEENWHQLAKSNGLQHRQSKGTATE